MPAVCLLPPGSSLQSSPTWDAEQGERWVKVVVSGGLRWPLPTLSTSSESTWLGQMQFCLCCSARVLAKSFLSVSCEMQGRMGGQQGGRTGGKLWSQPSRALHLSVTPGADSRAGRNVNSPWGNNFNSTLLPFPLSSLFFFPPPFHFSPFYLKCNHISITDCSSSTCLFPNNQHIINIFTS